MERTREELSMTDDSPSRSIWLWRGILQRVGGNESSGCKPREHQAEVADGVGECRVVWSAISSLKKVQYHLAFTVR